MMMNTRKNRLTIAIAGSVGLLASTAQAIDFTASTTLQNTLTVAVVNDFDLGTVFATKSGAGLTAGVGALVIAADGGAVTDHPTDSAGVTAAAEVQAVTAVPADSNGDGEVIGVDFAAAVVGVEQVNLTSLTAATPAQGSVEMANQFTLILPDTSNIDGADFAVNAGASLANITAESSEAAVLEHVSGDPNVPNLYLMHFTIASDDPNDANPYADTNNNGVFAIPQAFGQTSFVFNIGATLTTEPTLTAKDYQEGIYEGTFAVTAAY